MVFGLVGFNVCLRGRIQFWFGVFVVLSSLVCFLFCYLRGAGSLIAELFGCPNSGDFWIFFT